MKSTTKTAIVVGVVLAAVAVVVVLFLRGMVFGTAEATHPPCDQLPTTAEATKALAEHREFADALRAAGKHVRIEVDNPCSGQGDRALIKVTYGSDAEEQAVQDLIATRDGFGVPVYVVEG